MMRWCRWLWHRTLYLLCCLAQMACILMAAFTPAAIGDWIDRQKWHHDERAWEAWEEAKT